MRRILILGLLAAFGYAGAASAQTDVTPVEPFKVGTFDIHGVPHVGVVLRDSLVIDIEVANLALEANPDYPTVPMPEDMIELIGRWDYGLKYRLFEIVNHVVGNDMLMGAGRADYVHDVSDLRTRPPIMYPGNVLNAAVNFYSHVSEGATPEERVAEQRRRREERGVPYLFLKPSRGAVIGSGDPIVIPHGRDRTDWEVELGAVIGRTARYVSAADAQDYVFGYLVSIDVSDRGGRPPGGNATRSDWFVGKGHDTFAPQGPWIVPKEFYGDPMQNLRQTLSVGGTTLQDAQAGDMIHSLWEIVEYASSIITLHPGDVINNGTSGGTAAGSAETRTGSRYLQPGEVIEASIDGIGTLRMPAVAGDMPTDELTGAQLPPIDNYR
jgi:2-keto-4-pentenoate hydratase/2-oxohepta-3-ene-1,7-dioic acid hydratase in catechol pathway